MTDGTVKTQGSRLAFVSPLGSPPGIRLVSCATGISNLSGPRDQIDITCLTSTEREYESGFASPAQVSVPFNAIPASRAHQDLFALKESGQKVSWMAILSDQPLNPTTTDSNGRLVSPGPTTGEFLASVADVSIDIATNEVVRGTLLLQRSGPITWNFPTATQP